VSFTLAVLHWLAAGLLGVVLLMGVPCQTFTNFLFLPTTSLYTTQYYVDSVGGLDSNNGLTPSTPFQTLGKMQTVCGTSGNLLPQWTQINLKCGSTWIGSAAFLFIDVSNVKITSYGTGALPKIDGRVQMLNASFTLTSGQTNTYQWTGIGLATAAESHNVFENGVRLARQTSIATVEANPGSYFAPAEGSIVQGSPYLIYVHSSDSTDVITNGKTYSTQGVIQAIAIGSTTSVNAMVYNVEVTGGVHHNGNLELGRMSYANNCVSSYGMIHSIYTDSGFFVDCISYDSEANCLDFVANKGSSTDGFTEMNGCLVDNRDTTGDRLGNGFFVHGSTHVTIRYINCICRHICNGFGAVGTSGSPQTILCDGCTFVCGNVSGAGQIWAFACNTTGYPDACVMTIHNCLADVYGYFGWGHDMNTLSAMNIQTCRAIIQGSGANTAVRPAGGSMSVTYSSFYFPSTGYGGAEVDASTLNFTWNNNICDGGNIAVESWSTNAGVYAANDNLYNGSVWGWRRQGTLYASFSAYQAGVAPVDAASVNAAPLWGGAGGAPSSSNGYDFSLAGGSPAIAISAGFTFGP
jgi:hypothetical protein